MSLLFTIYPVHWPVLLVTLIGGYLSGSVPYGLILGRMAGIGDIRKAGSGNIGATNVLRLGGKKLGAATLVLDALKGLVPVLIAKQIHMDYGVAAGLGAFIGHLFPVWLRFKGGKGVAVALGIIIALTPLVGLVTCLSWLAVAMMSGYSSAAALAAFGFAPLAAAFLTGSYQLIVFTFIIAVIVWVRHRDNIKRLAGGTESKINLGKK